MDGGAATSERTMMSCQVIVGPACEQGDGGSDEGVSLSVPNATSPVSGMETLVALQAMNSLVSNSMPVPAHPTLQPRNLCWFFDGTGNAAFFDQITNVATMFSLANHCDQAQLVYYQSGIGTPLARPSGMQFWPQRAWAWMTATLDKGIAFSLGAHVERGYAFLMNNWQPGDRIYLFGFSRGAFTARAVAGMLQKVGLLPKGNEESIPLAYGLYKRAIDVPMGLSSRSAARAFKQNFCRKVVLHFVGAFVSRGIRARLRDFPQALARDKRRAGYNYQPWIPAEGALPPGHTLQEVFFAGAHSNNGGGEFAYDYDATPALSHLSLRWMLREAVAAGFLLDATRVRESSFFATRRHGTDPFFADRRDVPLQDSDENFDPGCPQLKEYLGDLAASYPHSNQEIAELVYNMADQSEWRHDAAYAPRGDALSFKIQNRDPEAPPPAKKHGRIQDWCARQAKGAKPSSGGSSRIFPICSWSRRKDRGARRARCVSIAVVVVVCHPLRSSTSRSVIACRRTRQRSAAVVAATTRTFRRSAATASALVFRRGRRWSM